MTKTDSTTKTSSRRIFTPVGTPEFQTRHMAGIAERYRIEARELRRRAETLDRRAAKLDDARASGKMITREQMVDAELSEIHLTRYHVRRLAGIKPHASDAELSAVLFPHKAPAASTSAATVVSQVPQRAAGAISTQVEPAKPMDALGEAVAIARSMNPEQIDWSREPLTDRERRIRAVYLKRHSGPSSSLTLGMIVYDLRCAGKEPASDILAARVEGGRRLDEASKKRHDADLREAREAVDAGADGTDDLDEDADDDDEDDGS